MTIRSEVKALVNEIVLTQRIHFLFSAAIRADRGGTDGCPVV